MTTRAKFKCTMTSQIVGSAYNPKKDNYTPAILETTTLLPVFGGNGTENAKFFASTGEIKLTCIHHGLFTLGEEYYVDFTPAPKA